MTTSSTIRTRWWQPALVIAVGLVAAGCIEFSVQKQVTNGTSSGPFVVNVSCVNDEGTETDQLTFDTIDGSGQQTLSTDEFDLSPTGSTTCSFDEEPFPIAGVVVTIECVSPPPEITCSSPGETLDVVALASGSADFEVDIRVTNDFAGVSTTTTPTTVAPATVAPVGAADPSTPVIARPTLTG